MYISHIQKWVYIYMPACLSVCLVCLVCLVCRCLSMSVCLSVCLSADVCLYVCKCVRRYVCMYVRPCTSIRMHVCMQVCIIDMNPKESQLQVSRNLHWGQVLQSSEQILTIHTLNRVILGLVSICQTCHENSQCASHMFLLR